MNIQSFLSGFKNAFRGIAAVLPKERNFLVQSIVAIIVLILSIILPLSREEWIIIVFCIGVVLMAEAVNTALELTLDIINKEYDDQIKKAKDVAAAAVLIISISSAAIGLIIFLPYLKSLFF